MLQYLIPLWSSFIRPIWSYFFLPIMGCMVLVTIPVIIRKVVRGY